MKLKHVRMTNELAEKVAKERRYEVDFPSEAEMIRRLLEEAIHSRKNHRPSHYA